MTQNNIQNNEANIKNVDELIQITLENKRIIRRNEILQLVNDQGIAGIDTINRHLRKLLSRNEVVSVKYPDYKKYGINKEDKKAVYLVLASGTEKAKHYDTVIAALNSENPKIMKDAMIEIESFEGIDLLPNQLNNISNALKTTDLSTSYQIVKVIWKHFDKLIYPSNLKQFEENLITSFERHGKSGNSHHLRTHILYMLGIIESPSVIKFLKLNFEEFNITSLREVIHQYSDYRVAPIIEKYRTDLFNFSHELVDEKKELLFQIRTNAVRSIRGFKENITKFNKKLKDVKRDESL